MTTKPIAVPYDPEEAEGEFGWLWTDLRHGEGRWYLVSTWLPDGIDAQLVIRFHDVADAENDEECLADEWIDYYYMPISAPTCLPIARAVVDVHMPGGASLSFSHEGCGPEASAMTDAVIGAASGGNMVLPISKARRWTLDEHCGEVFERDQDYDGLALTIEIKNEAEAKAIRRALSDD